MHQSYLELKAASEQLFAQNAAQSLEETTPVTITARIRQFATDIVPASKADYVPVIADPYGLFGFCSDGVLEKIKHDGGEIVFGWAIWEWRDILFTAEFHAVWRSPEGNLVDITPKPMAQSQILFVPDESYKPDFNFDLRPPNKRLCAPEIQSPFVYAAERIASLKPSQRQYEEKRATKAGLTLEAWFEGRAPSQSRINHIEEYIAASNDVDRLMDEDPTPAGVAFTPGPELRTAMLRKIRLQALVVAERIKR